MRQPRQNRAAPLRVGIIGAGWIAQTHLRSISQLPTAGVEAVADVDLSRARAAAATAGARAYGSWTEMLHETSDALDAVVVCTPPQHHREPSIAALELGLAVYLEKPIARTQEDAEAILEAVKRTGGTCTVGYQWHSLAALHRIKQELSGQRLGLMIGRSIGPTVNRPWLLRRAEGGGQLLERASHHIDLQRVIAGEVTTVQARAGSVVLADHDRLASDIEDVLSIELTFAGGATGAIHVAWVGDEIPGIYDASVAASNGVMTLTLDPVYALSGTSHGQQLHYREDRPPAVTAMAHFLDGVVSGTYPRQLCAPADAAATLAVALACERSLVSGQPVRVD